jgi:hypothetical protein
MVPRLYEILWITYWDTSVYCGPAAAAAAAMLTTTITTTPKRSGKRDGEKRRRRGRGRGARQRESERQLESDKVFQKNSLEQQISQAASSAAAASSSAAAAALTGLRATSVAICAARSRYQHTQKAIKERIQTKGTRNIGVIKGKKNISFSRRLASVGR